MVDLIARIREFLAQRLLVLKARHGHVQNRANAFRLQARHDVGGNARSHGGTGVATVMVVGEHDDRAARIAGGHHHMLQCVARITLGIHNDQVGAQLGQALGQKHIGRERCHQVKATFQQTYAQAA